MAGQIFFALYIVIQYGSAVVAGDLSRWANVLPKGVVSGDPWGNVSLAVHLLLAAILTFGGPLQLIPQVRTAAPGFHRWTGRVYLVAALIASFTGLYLVWVKGTVGGLVQHLGVSFNALLILWFAAAAFRYAIARDFAAHRRWALRLFLAVSGVWFFRVGLMFWILANRGPVGFDPKTFLGPFLDSLSFAQTLLPLAALELYLRAGKSPSPTSKYAAAFVIFLFTAVTAIGIAGAGMAMWWPRMTAAIRAGI